MSQNTQDPNFQASCAALWNQLAPHTSIDRFHEKINVREKSIFLGYADITIGVGPHFSWKVRGVNVKMLNGKAHLDFPSERGADGKYYPQTFPKTAETRKVLTTLVFNDERVKQAMQNAAELQAAAPAEEIPASVEAEAAPAAAVAVPNPFEG